MTDAATTVRTAPAPAGSVAGRAALALALLLGYFVLVLTVLGALTVLTVLAFRGSGALGVKVGIFTAVVAAGVARAVFAVERRGDDEGSDGIPVTRAEQPELWGLVDEVAAELGVAPPDDLRLVDDVNAFVRQDTRLLGLVGGRRHMALGTAMVQALTVDQLRGVIAHELGHYAGGDTRLSALVYRAGATIERTVGNLGRDSLLGKLFGHYARLYRRVSLAVRRRQELRADEGSVRVAGRAAHESALRAAQAAGSAYAFFVDRYVEPLWRAGTAPKDLFAGFRALLADPARREQLDALAQQEDEPTDPYDSHPSLAARVAHVRSLPDRPAPGDSRPARALLRDPDRVEEQVTGWLNGMLLRRVPERLYAFTSTSTSPAAPSQELDPTPYVAGLAEGVVDLSAATASLDGGPQPASLDRTLALIEAGRDDELVTALTGDRRDLGEQARRADLAATVTGPVALAAALALVEAGRASWRVTWSRWRELVGADGQPLEVPARLEEALEQVGPRGLRPVLRELGVPLDAPLPAPTRPEADRGAVIAVWPDLRRGRRHYDALVSVDLLVLVRTRGSFLGRIGSGLAENYGIGRTRRRKATQARIDALLERPLAELAAAPEALVVSWDEVDQVELKSGVTIAWKLRFPGRGKPLDELKADSEQVSPPAAGVADLLRRLVGDRLTTNVPGV